MESEPTFYPTSDQQTIQYLTNRIKALECEKIYGCNLLIEVQTFAQIHIAKRDERIAELEAELAELKPAGLNVFLNEARKSTALEAIQLVEKRLGVLGVGIVAELHKHFNTAS
jgi:succinate dehydrogenase/fumarate reductase flavoprotein subunit